MGTGNSSVVLPSTEEELKMAAEKPDPKAAFNVRTCGEPNSMLVNIDKLVKNVTDQIQNQLGGVVSLY